MPEKYMKIALNTALQASGEIPVGCVIEKDGKILACAHNLREKENDITSHAEILAIRDAEKKLGNWRLTGCNLYVTLEPCPMCAWAILTSGIQKVYFGAYDLNYGALGSKMNLAADFSYKTKIFGGIMEIQAKKILDDCFLTLRK